MINEQFRDYFVGEKGYDAIKKLMKNGNEFCAESAKCFQDRYDIEVAYAKSLRRNGEVFQKLASRAKGSLAQAFTIIAAQTNVESETHNSMATSILDKISIPMKTLADTQLKSRKPIEEVLNGKFKTWKDKKDTDHKFRQRQFENCKDIEKLYLKMDEIPKTTKSSVKEVNKIEVSLQKLEQQLENTEKKYHDSTKEVELARQTCDAEMCRSCDQMQMIELERIKRMENFIQIYIDQIKILSETMKQITQELYSVRITPQDDIITEAKLNLLTTETEILLYDIYAEDERNPMSQERRVLSLMKWIEMLKQDIDVQRRSKDGIENLQGFCKQNQKFSSSVNSNDIFVNRESVRLLQCLYEGSLYKMEMIYNRLKQLPEPQYEYSQCFAKSFTDKGTPTTFLRIPFQPLSQPPPSAPAAMVHIVRSMPILPATETLPQTAPPPPYSVHQQPTIGWAVGDISNDQSASDSRSTAASTPPYPVLPTAMTEATNSHRQQQTIVRVLHGYEARHDDELSIRPGDLIVLHERRSDHWYRGTLNGKIGLFPGNFVQEL